MSGEKFKDENRDQMEQWLLEEFGQETLEIANRFIDHVGLHPYEEAAMLQRAIRGIENQHDLPQRIKK